MTNDTMLTVQGWIGSAPVLREAAGVPVLNFRVGCTPRRFDRATNVWVDGTTQWYTVSAWRRLAVHASKALRQGDPVLVHGRLQHRTFVTKAGVEAVALEIEAFSMGHDLSRGVSSFLKASTPAEEASAERPAETAA